jgi:hypothetical protein
MVALVNAIARAIERLLPRLPGPDVTVAEVASIDSAIQDWFDEETVTRTFLILCAIIPGNASSFSVGAVQFLSLANFAEREELDLEHLCDAMTYGRLVRTMYERSARWLAEVEVTGFDRAVSAERANLAIDVAIVALQISLPIPYSRRMARVTGRTMPATTETLYRMGTRIQSDATFDGPGHGIPGKAFDHLVIRGASILQSVGRRVNAYVQGTQPLSKLEQSWCDGA